MCLGQGVRRIETDLFKGTGSPNYGHRQFWNWQGRLSRLEIWRGVVVFLSPESTGQTVLCFVAQPCPTLCHPRDCSCQAPLSLGILQARTSRLETQAEFLFHSPKANSLLWGRSASALKTFSQLEETAPKSWRIMCFSLSLMTVNVNHFRKILQYEKHSHSNI